MQAIKLSLAIMCICLGMGIINSLGITGNYEAPPVGGDLNITKADGITELNSGSADDTSESMLGSIFSWRTWNLFTDLIYYTLLPGDYVIRHGGNVPIALAVQIACNAIVLVGGFQILTKVNLKGME
jgi:hypothetical protein